MRKVRAVPNRIRQSLSISAFVLLALCALGPASADAAPKLRVAPEALDFGQVKTGATATLPLALHNDGDAPLEVYKVQASCGCSKIELPNGETATIAAGTSLELPVHFDPGNRVGNQNAVIAITTNDPERPAVTIQVSAAISAIATVRPTNGLIWQQSARGAEIRRTVVIVPGDPLKDIDIVEVKSDRPELTVTANKVVRNGQKMVDMKFALAGSTPLGEFVATAIARVRVEGEETTISIPVRGVVVGDVVVTPMELNMTRANLAPGDRIGGLLVRGSDQVTEPRVLAALVDGPVRVEVGQPKASDQPHIFVHVADNAPAGPQHATVHVVTTSVDQPVIEVPVYFNVAHVVVATPSALVLDAAHPTQRVNVRAFVEPFVTITGALCDNSSITVSVVTPAQTDANAPCIVEITRATDAAPGDARLVIETSHPAAPEMIVPIAIRP